MKQQILATVAAFGAACLTWGAGASASAQSFPADADWIVLTRDGVPVDDPQNDAQDDRDIVGDADAPAAYVYADGDFLYFRLRLDADPRQGDNFRPFGWGVEIDTDGDGSAYELLSMVDGIANPDQVTLQQNTDPATRPSARDPSETLLGSWPTTTHARVVDAESSFGGDPDFFVDWAVDRSVLVDAGFDLDQPLRFAFGTSNNAQTLASDLSGTTTSQELQDILSDPVNCEGDSCDPCAGLCGEACLRCGGDTPACDGTRCVQCASSDDCPASTPTCDRDVGQCVAGPGCEDDTDCIDPELPACQPDGSCGECSAMDPSVCGGETPVCDTGRGRCVGCQGDADCGDPALPACQPDGSCGECSVENDVRCTGTTPVCDLSEGRCSLPCESDADCDDPALPACQPDGRCDECSADSVGACDPALEACNAAAGRCAEACSQDVDCPAVRPFCRDALVCTECTADDTSRCPAERPACDAEVGLCVVGQCENDADCDNPALPACLEGRCTQCSASDDSRCTGELDVCDPVAGICIPSDASMADGGVGPDGGLPDGGAAAGGGASGVGAAIEGGGIGCHVGRGAAAGAGLVVLLAIGVPGALLRRRRGRRR
jgi:hypothetical protein